MYFCTSVYFKISEKKTLIGPHKKYFQVYKHAVGKQGRRKFFSIGGGAESEGRRPEKIFKFRVSEMPFPGLWGRFDRILMVRKQRFSMSKFTIK